MEVLRRIIESSVPQIRQPRLQTELPREQSLLQVMNGGGRLAVPFRSPPPFADASQQPVFGQFYIASTDCYSFFGDVFIIVMLFVQQGIKLQGSDGVLSDTQCILIRHQDCRLILPSVKHRLEVTMVTETPKPKPNFFCSFKMLIWHSVWHNN